MTKIGVGKVVVSTKDLCFLTTPLAAGAFIICLPNAGIAAVPFGAGEPHVPSITVMVQSPGGEFSASDITGASGSVIPLNIQARGQGDANDIFSIGGLPSELQLTVGGRYNDLWIVKRKHLPELALIAPEDLRGVFQLTVTRAPTPRRPAFARSFTIRVEPYTAAPALSSTERTGLASTGSLDEARRQPVIAYRRNNNDEMLFERAASQFRRGDVAGARSIYEVLVAKGDADAAFALGETYDAVALNQLVIEGVVADEEKARDWYGKARQLGHPQAEARLNALEGLR